MPCSSWKTSNTDNHLRMIPSTLRMQLTMDGVRVRQYHLTKAIWGEADGERRVLVDLGEVVMNGMGEDFPLSSVVVRWVTSSCSSSSDRVYINPSTVPSSILSCVRCPTRANATLYAVASSLSLPTTVCTLHLEYLGPFVLPVARGSNGERNNIFRRSKKIGRAHV